MMTSRAWIHLFMACVPCLGGTVSVPISNHGFESDRNTGGAFQEGTLDGLGLRRPTGWTLVTAENTGVGSAGAHVAMGWERISPSEPVEGPPPPQAIRLLAGTVIGQVTSLAWSNLVVGDVLRLEIAAGDPLPDPQGQRFNFWADESFFGLSDGLAARAGEPALNGWVAGVVSRDTVPVPPAGLWTGGMGDVAVVHGVTEADRSRPGKVGVFIASLGGVSESGPGTGTAANASHWDNVRLSLTSPRPLIATFAAGPMQVDVGEGSVLAWDVTGASTVTLFPGLGVVPPSGTVTISPSATTTYHLVGSNEWGRATAAVTVRVVDPPPYRFYRFVPLALRDPGAGEVQIAEFQVLLGSQRLEGAVASNPGGRNPRGEGPQEANDGSLDTKWLDFNKRLPLMLDFGGPVVADAYRVATANDSPERDPVAWRVEGSNDSVQWALLDEQWDDPLPENRQAFTPRLPMVGLRGPVLVLSASTNDVVAGQSAVLEWTVGNADPTTVRIEPSVGPVALSGRVSISPSETTTYVLTASNGQGRRTRSVTVRVVPQPVPVIRFSASSTAVATGGTLTLSWSVLDAADVRIAPEVGVVDAQGSRVIQPTTTTTYTLTATGPGGTRTALVRVEVGAPALEVRTFDTLSGSSWLDPIGNLLAASASGTALQVTPIDYVGDMVGRLPGLTSPDSFAVLCTGWFDARVHGPGLYTFGTRSDDGSTLWLDLNNDGRFDGVGERVVNHNDSRGLSSVTGSVDVQADLVRVAIGYHQVGGQQMMQARFAKGDGLEFDELAPLPGASGAFSVEEPAGGGPIIRFSSTPGQIPPGGATLLSWSVDKATQARIEPSVGAVGVTGSVPVLPAKSTVYTLTATGPGGTRTASLRVSVVGVGPYRFYRFVPTRLRRPDAPVELSEFQLLKNGVRLGGAVASNPGGASPGGQGPVQANDDDLWTAWLDFRQGPLVMDFGVPKSADAYRWATGLDDENRDPLSWHVDGSVDGIEWIAIDSRSNHPVTTARGTFAGTFSIVAHPDFRLGPPTSDGSNLAITWSSQPGATYRVETSKRPTDPTSWMTWLPFVYSAGTETSLTLPMAAEQVRCFRVVALP